MTSVAIAIKVFLHRDKKGCPSAIHRVRGQYTWDEMHAVLYTMFYQCPAPAAAAPQQPRLVVEYLDDEGDIVQVSTAPEWDECVCVAHKVFAKQDELRANPDLARGQIVRPNTLRLFVREVKCCEAKKKKEATPEGTPGSHVDKNERKLARAEARQQRKAEREQARADRKAAHAPAPAPASAPAAAGSAGVRPVPVKKDVLVDLERDPVLQLLSMVTGVDAGRIVEEGPTHLEFHRVAPYVRKVTDHNLGDDSVFIAVDTTLVAHGITKHGLGLLNKGDSKAAYEILMRAAGVPPFDKDAVIAYNAACACVLDQGHEEIAIMLLQQAVRNGYDKPHHMSCDPDLESLRRSKEYARDFWAVVASI